MLSVQLDVAQNMSETDIGEMAAELDSYLDGLCIHQVTGETRIEPEAVERSLLAMIEGRARTKLGYAAR